MRSGLECNTSFIYHRTTREPAGFVGNTGSLGLPYSAETAETNHRGEGGSKIDYRL